MGSEGPEIVDGVPCVSVIIAIYRCLRILGIRAGVWNTTAYVNGETLLTLKGPDRKSYKIEPKTPDNNVNRCIHIHIRSHHGLNLSHDNHGLCCSHLSYEA